ncbi:MAG: site-specific DNA-methyltransferase [Myxococcota bacterium]
MNRPPTPPLTPEEKQEIQALLDADQPLPAHYQLRLFPPAGPELIWPGKDATPPPPPRPLILRERWGHPGTAFLNTLIQGDNLDAMAALKDGILREEVERAGGIKLIYIDPPFDLGTHVSVALQVGEDPLPHDAGVVDEVAYRDVWGDGDDSYLSMMLPRLRLMRELLADGGSIYVHCDARVNASLRLLMDEVFGRENFQNQICWKRTDPHNNARRKFGTVSDTILYYVKGPGYTLNLDEVRGELSESAKREYSLVQQPDGTIVPDGAGVMGRRLKLNDATVPSIHPDRQFEWRGARPSKGRSWPESPEGMEEGLRTGRYFLRNPDVGAARCKVSFLDENKGQTLQDIWLDCGTMKGGSMYATQKPEALLERIIKVSSNPGDLVADFFCGSGTTLVVAQRLGRSWVGADMGRLAIHAARKRLLGTRPSFRIYQGVDGEEPSAKLEAHVERVDGGVRVVLTGYEPLPGFWQDREDFSVEEGQLFRTRKSRGKERRAQLTRRWSDWIDLWAVDFEHDGAIFKGSWHSARSRNARTLPLVSETHLPTRPGVYTVAVKTVDVFGHEILWRGTYALAADNDDATRKRQLLLNGI